MIYKYIYIYIYNIYMHIMHNINYENKFKNIKILMRKNVTNLTNKNTIRFNINIYIYIYI